MDIYHHIAFNRNEDREGFFEPLGIKHKRTPSIKGDNYLISFDIYESHPLWPQVEALIKKTSAIN